MIYYRYAVPSHMETVFHEKVESLMPGLKLADSEIRKFLVSAWLLFMSL